LLDLRHGVLVIGRRRRRVVAKAEWMQDEANPRFVVTSLKRSAAGARQLYEDIYCARGDMENASRSASSISMPPSPRPPPCAPTKCGYGLLQWPISCCVPSGASALPKPHWQTPRHHPPQAPQDRRAGAGPRPPYQDRHGHGLPSR
jgi:hypothetical protein